MSSIAAVFFISRWTSSRITEEYYKAEINDCLRLLAEGDEESGDERGLLLALSTVGHKSSTAIRDAIYESAILNVLSDGVMRGHGKIVVDVSSNFRLNRNLPNEVMNSHLSRLCDAGFLDRTQNGQFIGNEQGRKVWQERRSHAVDSLLQGRRQVREYLENSLGHPFTDEHFAQIWKVFEEQIAHCFYHRGQQMVAAISLVAGKDAPDSGQEGSGEAEFYAIDVANAVAATSVLAAQAEELKTAILDLFSDREGPAADWLLRVCSAYVSACSLGLTD